MTSDSKLTSLLVLVDLRSAFNTTDHNILLQRLEHTIGIKGIVLHGLNHIFLIVNEEYSLHREVSQCVPQGSVLEPILFTLNMLPLCNIIRWHMLCR